MSCCGKKRRALKSGQAAPTAAGRGASPGKSSKLASIPGQPGEARASAAIRAFLARKSRPGR